MFSCLDHFISDAFFGFKFNFVFLNLPVFICAPIALFDLTGVYFRFVSVLFGSSIHGHHLAALAWSIYEFMCWLFL